ncbi:RES domain-containing protein [Marinomonas agarivorans]|nr:RES domain-containing protein [Marinomonas agarivorans]
MIWSRCEGARHIGLLEGTLFRLVESQQQIATLSYVDTLEEQNILEDMLDEVKPPYLESTTHLHYLLKTPFRYPPLRWGSRFGQAHETSIFYGGCHIETTLCEAAYYRFVFLYSMLGEPVKTKIRSEHTLFSVDYKTNYGIQLENPPFCNYEAELTHRSSYAICQQLGTAMREAGVEAFSYQSARAESGHCVGLFNPQAFSDTKPKDMSYWLCETGEESVSFRQVDEKRIIKFPLTDFLLEGTLPLPVP